MAVAPAGHRAVGVDNAPVPVPGDGHDGQAGHEHAGLRSGLGQSTHQVGGYGVGHLEAEALVRRPQNLQKKFKSHTLDFSMASLLTCILWCLIRYKLVHSRLLLTTCL